jgi:hypothetical protein
MVIRANALLVRSAAFISAEVLSALRAASFAASFAIL